jgi:hypothetical protein
MRTTLTLDEDVAARLQAEARRSGRSFKTVVNEHLRRALAQRSVQQSLPAFEVEPRTMGGPFPGSSYDNVAALIEEIEGVQHG